ncbi:MAG: hypothetical protein NT010_01800 [Proteobacteria bacterium]|nr:hypothetical protein [Pseudomonadota bacterium]
MDGKSLNITEEKINRLREIIPEAFTENKIDWEKLQASLKVPYLVSWNFTHLVKVKTRRMVNSINALAGFGVIEIISPQEL